MVSTSDDDSISLLMSMGFDSSQAQQALQICDGNVQRAVECLLGGNLFSATANASLSTSSNDGGVNNIIQSEITQYSNPLGRSACTAIALTLAHKSLELLHIDPVASPELRVDSALLTTSINEGIQLYSNLIANNNSNGGAEHSSVEDLLNACSTLGNNDNNNNIISKLKMLPNSPRQGILSSNNDHHNNMMSLEALLAQCQMDAATVTEKQAYIAVVITKPPETILVILPNNNTASTTTTSTNTNKYILIDSHPRPQQLSPHYPTGSYALFHPTLSSLVSSLKELFPVTELGDGVPDLMQMMYNSFDVYPFQLSSEE